LSAGEYTVTVVTRAKETIKNLSGPRRFAVNPGVFVATKKVTLKAGQTENVVLRYRPLDLNVFHGRHTAILNCAKSDGESAAGKRIWVGYLDRAYGSLPVFDGRVGPSGEVTLTGLTERVSEGVRVLPYSVWAGDETLGRFNFRTSEPSETFPMTFPPDAGDMAPDVDLIDVNTHRHVKLSSLRGKLVCLDFWATWSGPSQRGLKELDRLAGTKIGRDRMAIVALSIDDNSEDVVPHLSENSWTHLVPYWAGPTGIQSPAARRFAVKGIPKSFLIAPDGHILWRGHPNAAVSGKSLAARIQEALGP
jgi:thiol-disulfide isomerase/thioredoxin